MLTVDEIDAIAEVWIEQEDDGSLRSQRDQDLADLCASHREALGRVERAETALKNLVAKLDAIEPHVSNVCAIAQIHGVPYTGPNWADEIAAARAVLAQKG